MGIPDRRGTQCGCASRTADAPRPGGMGGYESRLRRRMQIAGPGQATTRYGHRAATLRRCRQRFTTGGAMQMKDVKIHTLWRTTFEQCELVLLGLLDCRLRLWIRGCWSSTKRCSIGRERRDGPPSSELNGPASGDEAIAGTRYLGCELTLMSRQQARRESSIIARPRPNPRAFEIVPLQFDLDGAPGSVRAFIGRCVAKRVACSDLLDDSFHRTCRAP